METPKRKPGRPPGTVYPESFKVYETIEGMELARHDPLRSRPALGDGEQAVSPAEFPARRKPPLQLAAPCVQRVPDPAEE